MDIAFAQNAPLGFSKHVYQLAHYVVEEMGSPPLPNLFLRNTVEEHRQQVQERQQQVQCQQQQQEQQQQLLLQQLNAPSLVARALAMATATTAVHSKGATVNSGNIGNLEDVRNARLQFFNFLDNTNVVAPEAPLTQERHDEAPTDGEGSHCTQSLAAAQASPHWPHPMRSPHGIPSTPLPASPLRLACCSAQPNAKWTPSTLKSGTRVHVAFGKGRQQTWYLGEVQNDEEDAVVRFGLLVCLPFLVYPPKLSCSCPIVPCHFWGHTAIFCNSLPFAAITCSSML